uniref:Uncharacterized protein n=1 Tax=Siphoviridae sp. ctBAZ2 TaxID=2827801 RepID=A0A8S5S7L0_9CAUD|nr:MAG TPA: hypothetical protein [Siphoviridae sp. ctBAZ2]
MQAKNGANITPICLCFFIFRVIYEYFKQKK